MEMLNGYKTYISVGAGVVCATAYGLGYIDQGTFTALLGICGFASVAGLRDAISNLFNKD